MKLFSRTRYYILISAALFLFGAACDTAYAFPKSALMPVGWTVSDVVIMAVSALLGVMGGLWVFLRTRTKRSRLP